MAPPLELVGFAAVFWLLEDCRMVLCEPPPAPNCDPILVSTRVHRPNSPNPGKTLFLLTGTTSVPPFGLLQGVPGSGGRTTVRAATNHVEKSYR